MFKIILSNKYGSFANCESWESALQWIYEIGNQYQNIRVSYFYPSKIIDIYFEEKE